MKTMLTTLVTIIEVLGFTFVTAYGFSGIYLLLKNDPTPEEEYKALIFGFLITGIFVLLIPISFWIVNIYILQVDAVKFGADSLEYVLITLLVWFIGFLIRLFK